MTKQKVENVHYPNFLDGVMAVVENSFTGMFGNKEDMNTLFPVAQPVILLRKTARPLNYYRMKTNHSSTHSYSLIRFSPLII